MSARAEFYAHRMHKPEAVFRQFDHDIPQEVEEGSYYDIAKRVVSITLPFFCLQQDCSSFVSTGSGAFRVGSYVYVTYESIRDGKTLSEISYNTLQTVFSVASLAATYFNHTLGLVAFSVADISINIKNIAYELWELNICNAIDEALLLASSAIYLSMLLTGSLEATLAFYVFHAASSLFQANNELSEGRYPEAIAKALMGAIRIYQANDQLALIERKNALLQLEQLTLLIDRIKEGRDIDELFDHPLIFVDKEAKDHNVVVLEKDGKQYDFGTHFFGYGKGIVKGMNLRVDSKRDYTELDFKVNHVYRKKLKESLEYLSSIKEEDMNDALKLFGSHFPKFSVKGKSHFNSHRGLYEVIKEVDLGESGSILIGADPNLPTLYDRIRFRFSKDKNIFDLHEAFSLLGISDALKASSKEDMERLKIGHLFRVFFPKSAFDLENSEEFFDSTIESLKNKIFQKEPKMKDVMDEYLPKMKAKDILPGKKRFHIEGLSDQLKEIGVKGLTASITGTWWTINEEESSDRLISICEIGMLSKESMDQISLDKKGLSAAADFYHGSSDSVFTQVVTENTHSTFDFGYWGEVRLLLSPKVLESGTYQYHHDFFGNRNTSGGVYDYGSYKNRPGIIDFAKTEAGNIYWSNEVMVKDRIDPSYITGVIFSNQATRNRAYSAFKKAGHIKTDDNGIETVLGKPIDKFFIVGTSIPKNLS